MYLEEDIHYEDITEEDLEYLPERYWYVRRNEWFINKRRSNIYNSSLEPCSLFGMYTVFEDLMYAHPSFKNYYRIKPLEFKKVYVGYGAGYREDLEYDYYVSSFEIVGNIDSIYDLIDDLYKTEDWTDLCLMIFHYYSRFDGKFIERAKNYFAYISEKYSDTPMYLEYLHYCDGYTEDYLIEDIAIKFIKNDVIKIMNPNCRKESHLYIIQDFIHMKWFRVVLMYIESLNDEDLKYIIEKNIDEIKSNSCIMGILKSKMQDDENIRMVSSIFNVDDSEYHLTVYYEDDERNEKIKESKVFDSIQSVRKYVVDNYKLSKEMINDFVEKWEACGGAGDGEYDCYFEII